eukprot:GHVR01185406.1.p1 GENE.GHVR01185406.1~~GHVR01185406.1.p1  ORF type:complete len:115 (-),score=4.51 GHVR01185406.1:2735-3079(-)
MRVTTCVSIQQDSFALPTFSYLAILLEPFRRLYSSAIPRHQNMELITHLNAIYMYLLYMYICYFVLCRQVESSLTWTALQAGTIEEEPEANPNSVELFSSGGILPEGGAKKHHL